MNDSSVSKQSPSKRSALSVWELPRLLQSVHCHRKTEVKATRERPHFRAILAFVKRNRFVVASQIKRRFAKYLKSDRTARRHLVEMESLGLLGVANTNNTGPLWPKVYFVTRRGVAVLKRALHVQGKEWTESAQDRRRSEGTSANHVLHEVTISEFLLLTWETTQVREDLKILTMQRRSLAMHDGFKVVFAGRQTRLQPDAMFLFRQTTGMTCCFIEIDMDSMSLKQMETKLRRYQHWAESSHANDYLKELYARHGATNPIANFRILIVVGSNTTQAEEKRISRLAKLASEFPRSIRDHVWMTRTGQLQEAVVSTGLLLEYIWLRVRDLPRNDAGIGKDLSKAPRHALFGS